MIRLVELECPNCGAELTQINKNSCKCTYCNARFLIDRTNPYYIKVLPKKDYSKLIKTLLVLLFLALLCSIAYVSYTKTRPEPVVEEAKEDEWIQSDFFILVLEVAFHKPFSEITQEDVDQITYLKLDDGSDVNTVYCQIQDGDMITITIPIEKNRHYRTSDYKYFHGLREFDVDREVLDKEDMLGLTNLEVICCGNNPDSLAEAISFPEKITNLALNCKSVDLAGIEKFTELECFKLRDNELNSLTQLANANKLKELTIDSSSLDNCAVVSSLSQLEKFSIDAENIKDLSCLSKSEKLESVEIIGTNVKDIQFLTSLPKLKRLILDHNNEIKDYSCIGGLAELEELEYNCSSNETDADLSGLTNLKRLTMNGTGAINTIQNLSGLEELSISSYVSVDCTYLASLTNLKSLKINTSYGTLENSSKLSGLTSLEKIDISDSSLMSDVSIFFTLPNLREVNFSNATVGLEVYNVPKNTNVKIINLSDAKIVTNIQMARESFVSMVDYDALNFTEYLPALCDCEGIEELYLKGNGVDSLDFSGFMPELRILDISDNYVTDLTPLQYNSKLEIVYVKDNPISQGMDLANQFAIDTETELFYSSWF